MGDELNPCPFCKSGAHTFHGWLWHVACDECGCKLTGFVTEAEAIAAWNQRADEFGADDDYERMMDELLCRLTNGKWSKSRSYSVDFMVSCVDEAYEKLYEKECATLESDREAKLEALAKDLYENALDFNFKGWIPHYRDRFAALGIEVE